MNTVIRSFTSLYVLALSANLAWGQSVPRPLVCPTPLADSAIMRTLMENVDYGSGHSVGAPIKASGVIPVGWHNIRIKLDDPSTPNKFYINELTGQIFTAISGFPKGHKYHVSLYFTGKLSVRPAQVGGIDVNTLLSKLSWLLRIPNVDRILPLDLGATVRQGPRTG